MRSRAEGPTDGGRADAELARDRPVGAPEGAELPDLLQARILSALEAERWTLRSRLTAAAPSSLDQGESVFQLPLEVRAPGPPEEGRATLAGGSGGLHRGPGRARARVRKTL
jgi:hypothetical protein